MLITPASLLYRLRNKDEAEAWPRFVDLYSPLLYRWAHQLGHQETDAADLVQDVFVILWQKLPEFTYDAERSFHAWLKTVFLNRYRSRLRQKVPLSVGSWGDHQDLRMVEDGFDEQDYKFLIRTAFRVIESEFSQMYQDVFRRYVLEGCDPESVAKSFDISPGTVYSIKSKVLNRLREALKDLEN